jgi:hypothetical protein
MASINVAPTSKNRSNKVKASRIISASLMLIKTRVRGLPASSRTHAKLLM